MNATEAPPPSPQAMEDMDDTAEFANSQEFKRWLADHPAVVEPNHG